jgi:hypothetical protein
MCTRYVTFDKFKNVIEFVSGLEVGIQILIRCLIFDPQLPNRWKKIVYSPAVNPWI